MQEVSLLEAAIDRLRAEESGAKAKAFRGLALNELEAVLERAREQVVRRQEQIAAHQQNLVIVEKSVSSAESTPLEDVEGLIKDAEAQREQLQGDIETVNAGKQVVLVNVQTGYQELARLEKVIGELRESYDESELLAEVGDDDAASLRRQADALRSQYSTVSDDFERHGTVPPATPRGN